MRTWLFFLILLAAGVCIAGCSTPSGPSASPSAVRTDQAASPASPSAAAQGTLSLHIDSLAPGASLPRDYTCTGTSESPDVSWDGLPPGTKSLVLILDDPDAPSGVFTHWLIYNIPPVTSGIGRAQSSQKVLENGAQQGDNSAGSRGYYPPCPPVGATHRYVFRLYALDAEISQPTADRASIDTALSGHILGKIEVVSSFRR
jgi:Raf kinase inhibitor-like YbhB/YbcL family protein